ncbi:serpin family protein [Caldisericum sp.]|uniref:serpin family protein n=1 Tax=Caldisericum sp. TaxID=2499687 RepID=UPI003D0FD449
MNKKGFAPIIIIIIAAVIIGAGFVIYRYVKVNSPVSTTTSTTINNTGYKANSVVEANNQFSLDLYKRYSLIKANKENIFFSPFSISSAIAMVYEGAKGKTAEEIRSVFHFPSDNTVLRESYQNIFNIINRGSTLNEKDIVYKLNTANALWVQKDYKLLGSYVSLITKYYNGEIQNLDFINNVKQAVTTINTWVENKTANRIKNLVSEDVVKSAKMVLTNAIYFKGEWLDKFSEGSTKDKDFKITPSLTIKVPMMEQVTHLKYAESVDAQLLELPYKSYPNEGLSMLILLPKNNDLTSLEKNLNIQTLSELVSKLGTYKVDVSLPKFKIETKTRMKNDLEAMGMLTAFSDYADFSGITGKSDLEIGDVIHQTFIENKEDGTEAAAATAIVMPPAAIAPGTMPPEKIYIFNANHPFIFLIQQKTQENINNNELGNILFMGRVVDPSAK